MALREDFEQTGNRLFRYRSYLPLFLIIPILLAMREFEWPLQSEPLHEIWEFSWMAVSFFGLAIRCKTIGHTPAYTSGRNTAGQLAVRLNTTGMYSIVRHPLYLGNFIIWLGVSMFSMSWWLVAIFVLSFWVYYERIMFAEEEFLRKQFGREFEEWASATPAFVPKLRGWKKPSLPFSWKNVLKREYTAMFAIVVGFFSLAVIEHYVLEGQLVFEPVYLTLGAIALTAFLILRTLKRNTRFLHVEGR